jgi:hypothetical protein
MTIEVIIVDDILHAKGKRVLEQKVFLEIMSVLTLELSAAGSIGIDRFFPGECDK